MKATVMVLGDGAQALDPDWVAELARELDLSPLERTG
jgi:hypothetical protein